MVGHKAFYFALGSGNDQQMIERCSSSVDFSTFLITKYQEMMQNLNTPREVFSASLN